MMTKVFMPCYFQYNHVTVTAPCPTLSHLSTGFVHLYIYNHANTRSSNCMNPTINRLVKGLIWGGCGRVVIYSPFLIIRMIFFASVLCCANHSCWMLSMYGTSRWKTGNQWMCCFWIYQKLLIRFLTHI